MLTTNADKLFTEFLKHDVFKSIANKEQLNYRNAIESDNALLRALGTMIYHKEINASLSDKDILERIIIAIKTTQETSK